MVGIGWENSIGKDVEVEVKEGGGVGSKVGDGRKECCYV